MYRLLLTSLLLASLAAAAPALGGDEVDYSAPYLVVEDGELVTRYPNREHEAAADQAGVDDSAQMPAPDTPDGDNRGIVFAGGLTALIIGLLLLIRRARRRSPRRPSSD